jgi:hypothetical protein
VACNHFVPVQPNPDEGDLGAPVAVEGNQVGGAT